MQLVVPFPHALSVLKHSVPSLILVFEQRYVSDYLSQKSILVVFQHNLWQMWHGIKIAVICNYHNIIDTACLPHSVYSD